MSVSRHPARRRVRARVAAVIVAVLASTAVATPAFAHDELLESSPAADEQLASAPEQIELRFSAQIMDLGSAVIVAGADDQDWVAGDPVVDGDRVTVPLTPDMADGAYEVRWRVVSSDGHPISGLIPFTVGDVAPAASAGATDTTDGATDEITTSEQDNPAADSGIPRAVWIGTIGAAVALAVFALVLFILRSRARRERGGSDDEPHQS